MSNTRTNPHLARVTHLLGHAELTHRAGLTGARDRFMRMATEVLDTQKVPQADTHRARLNQLLEGTYQ